MSLVELNVAVSNSEDTVSTDKTKVRWRKQSWSPGFVLNIIYEFVPTPWEDSMKRHNCRGNGNFTNTTQKH